MSNKTYDALAFIQRILLPAFATLLATLQQIWGWDIPMEQIVLTITAVDTFLGIFLKGTSNKFYDWCAELEFGNLFEDDDDEVGEG